MIAADGQEDTPFTTRNVIEKTAHHKMILLD
jgi:hypothetical protein